MIIMEVMMTMRIKIKMMIRYEVTKAYFDT